jgi:hypothetical protein
MKPSEILRRGREWSGREPSDIDEARKGELSGESESIEPAHGTKAPLSNKSACYVEAGAGIEPANSGFADRDLTTWLPRRVARADNIVVAALVSTRESFRSQAQSIEEQPFAAASSALGQCFNASVNPVIVTA